MNAKLLLKLLVLFVMIFHYTDFQAQVTIGDKVEPQPFSLLEISTKNMVGGLRLPQLTNTQRNDLSLGSIVDEAKKNEAKGLTIYNTTDSIIEFWDGSKWIPLKSSWNIATTTTPATNNNLDIYQMGRIGVGTNTITPSAVLEIDATDKGVLFPRVTLTSNTDILTIPNPAEGLLVYNTGAGEFSTEGYLFWSGTEWLKFNSGSAAAPTITGLQCSDAKMIPSSFTAGILYNGIMQIPYTGGNGGSYPAGSPILSIGNTGLTATLQAGSLAYGDGVLTYILRGIPLQSSPNAATFTINVMNNSCSASVSGDVLNIGGMLTFIGTMPNTTPVETNLNTGITLSSLYPGKLPTMDGLRMDLQFYNTTYYRPRIYNIGTSPLVISLQSFATVVNQNETLLNQTLAPGAFAIVDSDNLVYWTLVAAEVETANVQVNIAPGVWRWYEMKWWSMEISAQKVIFLSLQRKA